MFKRTSKFHWKKQLNMLLVCFLIIGSIPAMFAPQKAEAAALFPGGVETDLISWFELTSGWKENGTDDGQYIQKVGDLADSNREWTVYADNTSLNGQALDVLGTKLINYHLATVPKNNRVMFETNSALVAPASGAREVFSVQVAGTSGFPWDLGGALTSQVKYIDGTIAADFGTTSLKTFTPSEGLTSPNIMNIWSRTDDWVLSLNGHQEHQATSNQVSWGTVATRFHYIGGAHNSPFNKGNVAEILVFNRKLNDDERQKVNSYLALKYGITLQDASGNPLDYIASDGSAMWTAADNIGYGYRITGIGKDGALDQRQSKSEEDGALVAVALGDQFNKTSEENPIQMGADKSFFTFSDNGKDATYTVASDYNTLPSRPDSDQPLNSTVKVMERMFKVDKTDWQDQNITLEVAGADPANYQLYLLVSADETMGAEDKLLLLDGEGKVTLNSSELPDGGVFTFVKFVDKKPLQDKQTEIINENLTETDYTPESWQALVDQQQAAQAVLDNPDATLVEVQAALEALTIERAGLVKIGALPTPANLNLNESKLTWDAVENAEKYEVTITPKNGKPIIVDVPTGTYLDLATLTPPLTPGNYELTIIAKAGNDPAYTDSVASVPLSYIVPATPLTSPTNVKLEGNELTWDAVEHADAYEVTIKLEDGTTRTVEVPEGISLDLSTVDPALTPGTYELTVTAKTIDPEYSNSKASTAVNYVVPADKIALQNKVNEANGLTGSNYTEESWNKVEDSLLEAERVLNNREATQAEVNQAFDKLQQALNTLVPVKGKLDQLNLTGDKGQAIGLNPEFDPSQTNYAATVTNDVYSIGINPVGQYPADTEVRVSLNDAIVPEGDWDELPLQEGKNIVTVGVYDKNGNRLSEYTIEILRESVSSGGKLNSLVPSVGTLSPAFDPDHTSYAMSVTNSVYQLQLTPRAVDPEGKISIRVNNGNWKEVASGSISDYLPLNVGTNTINIKVTDKNGEVKDYEVTVTRESGNSGNDSGGGSTTSPTTPSIPSTPNTTENDLDVTLNGNDNPFATGTTSTSGGRTTTSVKIEQDKLAAAISEGKGQDLAVHSPKAGDMAVEGLTADTLKQLNDKGASLKVSNLLAIYPVPASNVNLSGVAEQLGNAALKDIAVRIDVKRSSEDLISSAKSKAADVGYKLLVDPVDLDLTFSHQGQTVRSGQLNGYAQKYIAIPEGVDPNRITTGVIVNPDGTVFHVPTVVTKIDNRYFALINDLRSSGTYSVIWNPQDFEDVKSHWGKEDVNNIAARLDLKGNGNNTFSPNRNVTRSEFAEIVVVGLGLMRQDAPQVNNFSDVPASIWYKDAVSIANEFDIVRGYDNGNFYGGQQITREQGFAMIARAYRLIQSEGLPGQEQVASTLAQYEDGVNVAAWAKADVAQLIAAGIIQGNGPELLSPKAKMTRAEVTALMARMLKATNLIDK